jgi:hypothetical protein
LFQVERVQAEFSRRTFLQRGALGASTLLFFTPAGIALQSLFSAPSEQHNSLILPSFADFRFTPLPEGLRWIMCFTSCFRARMNSSRNTLRKLNLLDEWATGSRDHLPISPPSINFWIRQSSGFSDSDSGNQAAIGG